MKSRTNIWSVRELEAAISSATLPDWAPGVYRQISSTVGQDLFPCLFARRARRLESWLFCFVDSLETEEGRETVREAVLAYFARIADLSRMERAKLPLLIVVRPERPVLPLEQYQAQAWGLLQHLHDRDTIPWPSSVSKNPDDKRWVYCFAGTPYFANFSAPARDNVQYRNLCDSLVLVTQPDENFHTVAGDEWDGERGRSVRAIIRKRVLEYTQQPLPEVFDIVGTPAERVWKQMAIPAPGSDYPSKCPFKHRDGAQQPE